ncbi:MAG TPA: class I SAM-dependent methyltransferase [Streptosporangiaceae bacterium]|nr:class I SAM-dependent methyltransferase [Streptosporangiaceae bacterium]
MGALISRKSGSYDDPAYNYLDYWSDRAYEHEAEVIAIRRLLKGRRFSHAVDIGGGYGRLSVVLADYADRVTLTDASTQQLDLAERYLARHPAIDRRLMSANSLDFPDESIDLAALVRVMHHLPDPSAEIGELSRILRPGGCAIIEVANSTHALNRLRYLVRGRKVPKTAVHLSAVEMDDQESIPFVNHHPKVVGRVFTKAGLRTERALSVSNLRHPLIKAAMPRKVLLTVERLAQQGLAGVHFGPSSFYLLEK